MEKPFKHYILTRYNLYLYSSNPYKVENKDKWMESRIPLFKRFLRSLDNQTVNDFTLVLSVDSKTPKGYQKEIFEILDKSSVRYVIQYDKKPKEFVINEIHSSSYIITSRCDSDDELLPEFVETIQEEFNYQEECLDTRGFKYDGKDLYYYGRKTVGSPFVSVIETSDSPIKTAAYKKHAEMKRYFLTRFVGINPLFVQHIHGGNVINAIRGEEKVKGLIYED